MNHLDWMKTAINDYKSGMVELSGVLDGGTVGFKVVCVGAVAIGECGWEIMKKSPKIDR